MQTITADFNTLMRQAPQTAHTYLQDCSRYLDQHFGEGYAAKHPEVLAAMIRASAQDFHTACLCAVLQDSSEQISSSLMEMAERLEAIGDWVDQQA